MTFEPEDEELSQLTGSDEAGSLRDSEQQFLIELCKIAQKIVSTLVSMGVAQTDAEQAVYYVLRGLLANRNEWAGKRDPYRYMWTSCKRRLSIKQSGYKLTNNDLRWLTFLGLPEAVRSVLLGILEEHFSAAKWKRQLQSLLSPLKMEEWSSAITKAAIKYRAKTENLDADLNPRHQNAELKLATDEIDRARARESRDALTDLLNRAIATLSIKDQEIIRLAMSGTTGELAMELLRIQTPGAYGQALRRARVRLEEAIKKLKAQEE